jgi:hypothetical protein
VKTIPVYPLAAIVSLTLIAVAVGAYESRPMPQAKSAVTPNNVPASAKGKHALLVGINTYKYPDAVPGLFGALNDVDDVRDVLTGVYKFSDENIHILRNEQATRLRIFDEIETHLIKSSKPGDVVVLYFSGHGSRMDNPDDPTGLDNTIVPYDSRDPDRAVTDIRDKELNSRVHRMIAAVGEAGAVTVVLDSCHSGTGLRGGGSVVRAAPDDKRFGRTPPAPDLGPGGVTNPVDRRKSGYGDGSLGYALIAGSLSEQSAYERRGERPMGALTYYLLEELRKLPPSKRSYQDVMELVAPRVNREFKHQLPQLEGKARQRVVFGDETIETRLYLLAHPTEVRGVARLEAGSLHGMTSRSEFDLYPSDARLFAPPEQPLARLIVSKVNDLDSTGAVVPPIAIADGARAIERKHMFPIRRSAVLYDGVGSSPALQRLKLKLEADRDGPFESVGQQEQYRFRLAEANRRVQIFGLDGEPLSSSVAVDDPKFVEQMEERLLHWDRWFSILTLENPSASIRLNVDLTPAGAAQPLPKDDQPSFTPGAGADKYTLQISTSSRGRVYIYVLDVASTGTVEQIFPPQYGGQESIELGQPITQPGGADLPRGVTYERDVYKVVATSEPTDLSFLQLQTPRSGQPKGTEPRDALGQLFFRAAMGLKGDSPVPKTWTCVDVTFEVCAALDPRLQRCPRPRVGVDAAR